MNKVLLSYLLVQEVFLIYWKFLNSNRVNYYEIILGPVLSGLESDDETFKNRADTIVRRVGTHVDRRDFFILSL